MTGTHPLDRCLLHLEIGFAVTLSCLQIQSPTSDSPFQTAKSRGVHFIACSCRIHSKATGRFRYDHILLLCGMPCFHHFLYRMDSPVFLCWCQRRRGTCCSFSMTLTFHLLSTTMFVFGKRFWKKISCII